VDPHRAQVAGALEVLLVGDEYDEVGPLLVDRAGGHVPALVVAHAAPLEQGPHVEHAVGQVEEGGQVDAPGRGVAEYLEVGEARAGVDAAELVEVLLDLEVVVDRAHARHEGVGAREAAHELVLVARAGVAEPLQEAPEGLEVGAVRGDGLVGVERVAQEAQVQDGDVRLPAHQLREHAQAAVR